MNFTDAINENGRIPTYHLENEIEFLSSIDKNKPSSRIIKTKKGKKTIALLKNIEINHNHSWHYELKKLALNDLDSTALFYRGKYITFKELFQEADRLAAALIKMGIKPGDEIPACLANVPETIYFLLAANKIGAKVNLFGAQFDKEFLNEILADCTDKVFFATDNFYGNIKDIIEKRNFQNKVVISLTDSLPKNPQLTTEYERELDRYYYYENNTKKYKNVDSSIMTYNECLEFGKDYNEEIIDNGNLETEFLITYDYDYTNNTYSKNFVYTNRSLITSGIFQTSKTKGLRELAYMPIYINANVITCISDRLMQLGNVALEPEYEKNTFLDVLFLNKPNYCNATIGHIIEASKQYLIENKFNGRKMPFLSNLSAIYEGNMRGEEALINMFLKNAKDGIGFEIGGKDIEHQESCKKKVKKRECVITPAPYVHVTTLRKYVNGSYWECNYNERGLIVTNSATATKGYNKDKEATRQLIITDEINRDWISSGYFGYVDDLGNVHVKDHYKNNIVFSDGSIISKFYITEVVLKDANNILSCIVTTIDTEKEIIPVINIEFQPFRHKSDEEIIDDLKERILSDLPIKVINNCVIRIFDNKESFPLLECGRRNLKFIEKMGLNNTFKVVDKEINYFDETINIKKRTLHKYSK